MNKEKTYSVFFVKKINLQASKLFVSVLTITAVVAQLLVPTLGQAIDNGPRSGSVFANDSTVGTLD